MFTALDAERMVRVRKNWERERQRSRDRPERMSVGFEAILTLTNINVMAKKKPGSVVPKLADSEQELLARLEQGDQLETDFARQRPGAASVEGQRIVTSGRCKCPHGKSIGTAWAHSSRRKVAVRSR